MKRKIINEWLFELLVISVVDTTKDDEETIAPQNGMEVDDDDLTQDPDATTGTGKMAISDICVMRKSVFPVSNQVRHKLGCTTTEIG